MDEKIIPSKTCRNKIHQQNPEIPTKWGFKNLVRTGASGFMTGDVFSTSIRCRTASYNVVSTLKRRHVSTGVILLCVCWKKRNNGETQGLKKCAQVDTNLCKDFPSNMGYKVFFDNWFSNLDLMHYLKKKGLLAVGTIRSNYFQNVPLNATKDLQQEGRGAMYYGTEIKY